MMNCHICPHHVLCKSTKINHCNGGRYVQESKFKIGDSVRFSDGRNVLVGKVINTYKFGLKYMYTISSENRLYHWIHESFIYNKE